MRQGGRELTNKELFIVMGKIEAGKDGYSLFSGLQGIEAENTAPFFDDALESLVQQYGYWSSNYNVDLEYNREDFREEAIRRALWAILVVQGYTPYDPYGRGYGDWSGWDELAAQRTTDFTATSREEHGYDV